MQPLFYSLIKIECHCSNYVLFILRFKVNIDSWDYWLYFVSYFDISRFKFWLFSFTNDRIIQILKFHLLRQQILSNKKKVMKTAQAKLNFCWSLDKDCQLQTCVIGQWLSAPNLRYWTRTVSSKLALLDYDCQIQTCVIGQWLSAPNLRYWTRTVSSKLALLDKDCQLQTYWTEWRVF